MRKPLAAVIGAIAATAVFQSIPREESGRVVAVKIAADGSAEVRHVSGPQYLRAYLDVAGIPTACDGITRGVRMGRTYTEADCTARLEQELLEHAVGVMACAPQLADAGRDYPRAAAVSLAYNIGVSAFCRSTAAARFRARDWRAGCEAMKVWNKARVGGTLRPVQGLTARRQREWALCLKGV